MSDSCILGTGLESNFLIRLYIKILVYLVSRYPKHYFFIFQANRGDARACVRAHVCVRAGVGEDEDVRLPPFEAILDFS